MYKFIRPLLFKMSPEAIHRLTVGALRIAGAVPGGKALLRALFSYRHPSLEREVFGLRFPNPIGMAAGFDKDAEAYGALAALGFGFVEIGTVTPRPQPGNPRPRLFRLPEDSAIINRMGFNNKGIEHAVERLRNRNRQVIVGGNIGKNTLTPNENAASDYLRCFRSLYEYVDYFVVNVSCPNVKNVTALQNRENIAAILDGLFDFRRGQNRYRPILLKISPDLTDEQIDMMTDIMMETPLDGIVATNTTTSREGLRSAPETVARIGNGGLSGAPLAERSIEVVRRIHERSRGTYPIIGVGGVMTPAQAKAMLDAGASLVQVYSGLIYNGPGFVREICRHLTEAGRQRAEPAGQQDTGRQDTGGQEA